MTTNNNHTHDSSPPRSILDTILHLINEEERIRRRGSGRMDDDDDDDVDNNDNNPQSSTMYYTIKSIEEAKSAQQQVFILQFQQQQQQQQPTSHHRPISDDDDENTTISSNNNNNWCNALKVGNYHLVLRIWYGGSSWWNLHRNTNPIGLATKEVMGYRVAYTAFVKNNQSTISSNNPRIPRVVYFHENATQQSDLPWAVLEYVGPNSMFLKESKVDTTTYFDTMIKVRKEFGFDEPHPRWGRVPIHQSLQYSQLILHRVMIPLHYQTAIINRIRTCPKDDDGNDQQHQDIVHTYSSMVNLYRDAYNSMVKSLSSWNSHNDNERRISNNHSRPNRMKECLDRLDQLLMVLESNASSIEDLPPVLVHMDLQPQNLIFCQSSKKGDDDQGTSIFSVLDWEDTGWADPRFDLLLLCRKVCSNRNQAESIWSEYEASRTTAQHQHQQYHHHQISLGPIDPWLQLETVHSITTMLLQSMDLLNGGRNPWETKTDLWGKLEREFLRWDSKHYDTDRR
jgi:thiamine kinase-like enzyme